MSFCRWRNITLAARILTGLLLLAVAGRAALPYYLKAQINRRLARVPGYSGKVDSIGVHFWHGGYSMQRLVIERNGAKGISPFVTAREITFTIAYRDLLRGRFTGDVTVQEGRINFVRSAVSQAPGLGAEPVKPWRDVAQDLFPIKLTHFELHDGQIRFADALAKPQIDLVIDHLDLTANGLRNRVRQGEPPLPATITANGRTIGEGQIHLVLKAEPLAAQPHFELKLALENLSLPSLNSLLQDRAKVEVSHGILQLYVEASAAQGAYRGYVKPMVSDLDFKPRDGAHPSHLQHLWQEVIAAVARLMRDKEEKQLATIIPFQGRFSQSWSVGLGATVRYLFHNGFVQTLRRGVDDNPAGIAK